MQLINTIIAKPNMTIQLATGNSVVDALMSHQTPSMELRPDMERPSDRDGISRCLPALASLAVSAELAQRSCLDGLRKELAVNAFTAFANWQMSAIGMTRESVNQQLADAQIGSSKSSGNRVHQDLSGKNRQETSLVTRGTRSTGSKRQGYQCSFTTYSTSI